MRVLQCMASIMMERGGPSVAIRELSSALVDRHVDVTVIAHDDGDASNEHAARLRAGWNAAVLLKIFHRDLRLWQLSFGYAWWVARNIKSFDFVIVHSLFLSHTFIVTWFARRAGVPYSVRPHGALTANDLRRRYWMKWLYLRTVDRNALRRAHFIFCTSPQEIDACALAGFHAGKLVRLGVADEYFVEIPSSKRDRDTVLFLGRLAEKKGVDILIRALGICRRRGSHIRAVIAGPDDSLTASDLKDIAAAAGVSDLVEFRGFTSGTDKFALLARCGAFVLPSKDENFGVAPAEALAMGTPVIVSPGVSHSELIIEAGGGIVADRTPDDISDAILNLVTLPESAYEEKCRQAMRLARNRFRWGSTAGEVLQHIVMKAER